MPLDFVPGSEHGAAAQLRPGCFCTQMAGQEITTLGTPANLACIFNLGSISYSSHRRSGLELDFQRALTSQKPSSAASIKLQL